MQISSQPSLSHYATPANSRCTHLGNACHGRARRDEIIRCFANLDNFVVTEAMHPSLGMVLVVFRLPYRLTYNLLGEIMIRLELVILGDQLTRSLDAVRKDGFGGIVVAEAWQLGRLIYEGGWSHWESVTGGGKE